MKTLVLTLLASAALDDNNTRLALPLSDTVCDEIASFAQGLKLVARQ